MKISTTLCLVRHGETDWNVEGKLQGCEDIELNEEGRLQAVAASRYFKIGEWDVVVSSPLKRAYETAKIIAFSNSIPAIHIVNEFSERDYGKASGLKPDELANRYPDGIIPDLEEFEHLQQRAISGLAKIVNTYPGKRIIVISHGGLINSILYSLSGGDIGSFKTKLINGSISKLKQQNNNWIVEFYNKSANELLGIETIEELNIQKEKENNPGLIGDLK